MHAWYSAKQAAKLGGTAVYELIAADHATIVEGGRPVVHCTDVAVDRTAPNSFDDLVYVGEVGAFIRSTIPLGEREDPWLMKFMTPLVVLALAFAAAACGPSSPDITCEEVCTNNYPKGPIGALDSCFRDCGIEPRQP